MERAETGRVDWEDEEAEGFAAGLGGSITVVQKSLRGRFKVAGLLFAFVLDLEESFDLRMFEEGCFGGLEEDIFVVMFEFEK